MTVLEALGHASGCKGAERSLRREGAPALLVGRAAKSGLKEVPIKEATMHRRLVVTYRHNSYLSPAAARLIALLEAVRNDD
jgi:hypothetical protein